MPPLILHIRVAGLNVCDAPSHSHYVRSLLMAMVHAFTNMRVNCY